MFKKNNHGNINNNNQQQPKPKFDHAAKIEDVAKKEARKTLSDIEPSGEAAYDEDAHADATTTADANFNMTADEAKLEELEKQVIELTEKVANAEKYRLLALADMENLRKRNVKEMENLRKCTVQDTVFPFLQVFDYFTMAVDSVHKSADVNTVIAGMDMIAKEFERALNDLNITPLDAVGKTFDPAIHEAVAEESSDTVPQGTVLKQWCRGYQYGSYLLKPAKVVVSSGPKKEEKPAESASEDVKTPEEPENKD